MPPKNKDKENEYSKWGKWIISIVFLAGVTYATIYFNTKGIKGNTTKIDTNVTDIKKLAVTVGKIDVIEARQGSMQADLEIIKKAVINP